MKTLFVRLRADSDSAFAGWPTRESDAEGPWEFEEFEAEGEVHSFRLGRDTNAAEEQFLNTSPAVVEYWLSD